jgi:hypothetical protein
MRSSALRYRELNIMNRVLNKGLGVGSYLNSALLSFSDVFRPASCMQSCHARESKESFYCAFDQVLLPVLPLPPVQGIEEEW